MEKLKEKLDNEGWQSVFNFEDVEIADVNFLNTPTGFEVHIYSTDERGSLDPSTVIKLREY